MQTNYILKRYRPKSIITTCEYSFTSSVLTDFCEENNCSLINIMHGEKLFCIRDSFFSFTKCYVLNELYIDLFIKLRAERSQFGTLPLIKKANSLPTKKLVYYLQIASNKEIKTIFKVLYSLKKCGFDVFIRPHPTYSKLKIIKKLSKRTKINIDYKNFNDSFNDTFYCVSMFSTVLAQSYYSGTNTIIDDVTNNVTFKKLIDLDYWLLHKKEVIMLSEFLKRGN